MSLWKSATAAIIAAVALSIGAGSASAASCPWMNRSLPTEKRAEMLLDAMSLSDKIAMTWQQYPLDYRYGAAGYIPANANLCIPPLVMNDAGQGVGDGQTNTTAFPAPIADTSSWDPRLLYTFGQALGQEAWEKGIDVQLTPGMETDRVPMNGRNWEYESEDPFLSGQGAAAVVKGIQSQHVIVTLKHYIANSQEMSRSSDSADVDQRTLEEIYAPQYDTAIHQGGAMGVMCSYNRINGTYSCENPQTLKGILDKQFGFAGFVVSDWGATHSTVASALNGLDIEMNVIPGTYYGSALQTAVQKGQVPPAVLDDMVLRILRAMFKVGVFDHPPAVQPQAYAADVNTPAHQKVAQDLAEEGSVLLKNQGGVLPITGQGRKIALIGTDAGPAGAENEYNGEGSGHIPEFGFKPVVSPLQGIEQRAAADGDTVVYSDGSATQDAVAAAKAADVAVVVVGDSESEGTDRSSLTLTGGLCTLAGCTPQPYDQNALVAAVAAANPNTVVVLETGGPVLMPWLSQVKGLFEAWYPGEEGGNAIASLLFGDADPSGHLTETFPAAQSDLPLRTAAQWPGVSRAGDSVGPHSTYSEGLLVGYRWYQAKGIKPLFPFGYGLSYTTFAFSRLRVRAVRGGALASFTLTNTGQRAGADVTQVYIGDPPAAAEPPLQLKGFRRVYLAPGQSERITVPLSEVAFSHWDTKAQAWKVTSGRYAIRVGDSSADLPLRATLHRARTVLSARAY